LTYIFAADSMGIHYFSRNYAWKSKPLNLKLLVRKQSFT